MQKAMGSQYLPQPDARRDTWADIPTGDDDDYDDAWADTPAATTDQNMATVVPMSVDQQPQQQGNLPTQTYVPPDVRSVQDAILVDIHDKAKIAGRSQADKAAGGKQSPVRTTGAISPDQLLAELNARPQRTSS